MTVRIIFVIEFDFEGKKIKKLFLEGKKYL